MCLCVLCTLINSDRSVSHSMWQNLRLYSKICSLHFECVQCSVFWMKHASHFVSFTRVEFRVWVYIKTENPLQYVTLVYLNIYRMLCLRQINVQNRKWFRSTQTHLHSHIHTTHAHTHYKHIMCNIQFPIFMHNKCMCYCTH